MDYLKEFIADYNKIVILQEKASTTSTTINLMHLRHEVLQPQVNALFIIREGHLRKHLRTLLSTAYHATEVLPNSVKTPLRYAKQITTFLSGIICS